MLLRLLMILAAFAYNALVVMGLWRWEWPVGVVFVLLLVEIVVLGFHHLLELVRAGAELGRPFRALLVGVPSLLAMVGVAVVAAGFAAYYSWITGTQISMTYLTLPLIVLGARYLVELVVSLFLPEPYVPSILLHRFWFRALSIGLGILAVGVPLFLWIMSSFPWELPDPGEELFQLAPYVEGLEALVPHTMSAATLTLLIVIKWGIETHSIWAGNHGREARQWAWVDRVLGVKSPTGPSTEAG